MTMSISQSLRAIAIMPKSLHSQLKRFFGFKSTVTTPPTNTTEKPSPNTFSLQVEETESVTTERGSEPELEEAILADMSVANATEDNNDHLVQSSDASHPANLIPELCRKFYSLGWVTGTGGGISIRRGNHIFIAPSGVQKEMMQSDNIFVLSYPTPKYPASARQYIRKPLDLKPSACTPLFLAAFDRDAGACIHTHSQWAVLVTLLVEREKGKDGCFEISQIEQIKGIPRGKGKGMLGYFDTLKIPIIENTAFEEDLTESLEKAMNEYPDTYAVLVRRHGIYVWGDTEAKAKTQCESLDYLFQLAVEMHKLGLPWT